ncbi:alpha/beta-hydrolase [Amylostereum chailletii]|nr:alpha/beta-hydrolase [Amylostereum chailletii]
MERRAVQEERRMVARHAYSPPFLPVSAMFPLTSLASGLALYQVLLGPNGVLAQDPSVKTVDLGYATYQTDLSLQDGVTSFLGIRYAAPPLGELRFQSPQPPVNTTGVQNATSQPIQCMQDGVNGANTTSPFRTNSSLPTTPGAVTPNTSEDCLYLNVHVPTNSDPSNASLPVVVWIHGGGYDAGSVAEHPVELIVSESNFGAIAVQMQYRLGVFGFLAGEQVKQGGALNAGLLDQQFALEWVQEHIAEFGGDPTKVTIWGESAGAGSVLQHVVAHGGQTDPPLFRAAMMSSPFLPFQYNYDDPIWETIYDAFVEGVHCTGNEDTLACLRSVNASALQAVDITIGRSNFMGVFTLVPVIDGSFIVERPLATLQKNRTNSDVLLVVTNAHEGDVFTNPSTLTANNFTLTEYITQLFPRMDDGQIQQAVGLYANITGLTTVPEQAALVYGENIFVCPAYASVAAFPASSAWKAEFAIPPALHGQDIPYYFPDSSLGLAPAFNNTNFLHAFEQAFFATAMSLDPNVHFVSPDITPAWPAWTTNGTVMLFNMTEAGEPEVKTIATDEDMLARCAFWNSMGEVNSQ